MRNDLKEYAMLLGKDREDVKDILRRAEFFEDGKFGRLLRNQWLKEGGDVLNRPAYPKYSGSHLFPLKFFEGHGFFGGTTDTGKTTFLYGNACNLIERDVGLLLPDIQGDYSPLGIQYPDRVKVLSLNETMINPLERYGSETNEQVAARLAFNMRDADYIRDASDNALFETVMETLDKYDSPTLHDLYRELRRKQESAKQRDLLAYQTLCNRTKRKITETKAFNCRKGFPLDFFKNGCLVMDVRGYSVSLVIFVINHLILAILNNSDFSDRVRTIVILEEAHILINRQRESRYDLGEPPLYQGLRLSRKVGLNFILVSQTVSNFSAAILGNLNFLALGKLTNGPCVRAAALRLSLNEDQIEALQGLPQRNFLIVTPEDPEPKLLGVPEIKRPGYDARELEVLTREHLSKIPFVPFDPKELEESPKRNQVDKKLLWHFHDKQFLSVKDRAVELGMPPETVEAEISRLEQRGMLKTEYISFLVGRPRRSATLTALGLEYIGCKDSLPGKGGLTHKFLVHEIQRTRKNPSFIEYKGSDLAEHVGDEIHAYEVEINPSEPHIEENIRRDAAFASRIFIVTQNQAGKKAVAKKLEGFKVEGMEKTEVKTIQEVLNEPVRTF
jgi:hypothetical protein